MKTFLRFVLLVAVVAAAALLVRFASVETGLDAVTLRDRLAEWGPWGPLLYILVVAVGVALSAWLTFATRELRAIAAA